MNSTHRIAALLASTVLASATLAQGETCATATAISGTGTFAFSNIGSTNDGPFACGNIGADVWFAWTATTNSSLEFSTCDPATDFDTVVAMYDACGGTFLACDNDSGCNFSSELSFTPTNGTTYLIRIGGAGGATGNGVLTIEVPLPDGGCTDPSIGADVIVGELTGPSNYAGQNGVGAYSIGTTSCNIGTVPLDWFANNTNHPVIGQNIYRHEGNRFELIGISYLKHGFTALQGNVCCSCVAHPNGTRLGIGCSDPYGSGLNGSQGGLGPRWQVNAHTGAFSYPFSQQGQGGNSIFKRIQVENSDLDPALHPSARIVGEGQYIAPDDAAAGNGNNNVSWREMTVGNFSNGRWNLSFDGNTRREQAAIRAWRVWDAEVELTDVQVPNEGLFIVGNKASDNGDGTWNYEYAVYNMNSHASGGSFSVPVPAGVTVTNIGFHDVDYHSGEPYDDTDWVGVRGTDNVTWATDSFATNPDANAIRWGTLYNFRFDADRSPSTVDATLGLFRPNTPSSMTVAVRGPECDGITATETPRLGSPANPAAFLVGQTSRPVTGGVWDPVVDHSTFYPSATMDFLAINLSGVTVNVPSSLGTILCNPPQSPSLIFLSVPGVPFSVAVPDECRFVGKSICTQAGSFGGSQGLQLANAIDLVIGNQ